MTVAVPEPVVELPSRYHLLETLKESATTCVYRVLDLADDREKTIKVLQQEFSEPRDVLQFKTEFAALAALDHPGIIRVFDFGLLQEKYPFFTMEFFPGKRITDHFDGQSWDRLNDILLQIGSAIHHIHNAGMIHLDLKPSNVLVNEEGKVKIVDFGLAAETNQVFDRRIRGTLHYMAPEILRQDHVDGRADLYALGMTLYETVTGALPTYGKAAIDIIRFHLNEELKRPALINPNVPDKLERIIIRLLEKDPRNRYQNTAALLQDIALLSGERVEPGHVALPSGELLAAPLVGRDSEGATIAEAIQRARDGKGGGLLVLGTEGTGKSRLVREATLRAQLDGARVFTGRCPINRKSIYAPFFDIFRQMVGAISPDADPAAELRRILKPAGENGGAMKPSRGEKFRLYNRIVQSIQDIYGFLSVSASAAPLILIVEDLQWVDPASLELLFFLIGEAKASSLLVIGVLTVDRAGEVSDETTTSGAYWETRAKDHGITVFKLDPLTEGQVAEYVEALLGAPDVPHNFVRWILWESGGAPLHIRKVVQYLMHHGYIHRTADGWAPEMDRIQNLRIPGGAAAIWAERLETLTSDERELLQLASVLGEHVDLSILTALVERDVESVYERVHSLAELGLLDESVDGRTFSFPQISLRESIYSSAPESRRAEAHRKAAGVLEKMLEQGATEFIGQAAYHFARGNDHAKGIEYSIKAGDLAASTLAHEQSAEFYRIALELMDLTGEEERKSEIREKLGDAYYRSSNYRGAMQVYQFLLKSIQARAKDTATSLRSARIMKKIGKVLAKRGEYTSALSYFQNAAKTFQKHGTASNVADMLSRIAWVQKEKGDLGEAEKTATQAFAILESTSLTAAHGFIKNTLGLIAFARCDWQRAHTLFEEARQIAVETDSEQLRKIVSSNIGGVLWKLGRWDDALGYYRRSLEESETEGDLWELVNAYNNVGRIEMSRGNFHAAADLFEKSIRFDEKLGSTESEAVAQESLGEALEMIGRWSEARERYQRCIDLEGFDELRTTRISVYVPLARLTSKIGDISKALDLAQRAYEAADRVRDEALMAEAAFAIAQIEMERENHSDAARFASEAMRIFETSGTIHGVARTHSLLAEICYRQQNTDESAKHVAKAVEISRQLGDRYTLAINDWIGGKLLFAAGEREPAEEKFEKAHLMFEELDTPYELGRSLFDLGVLRTEPDEAVQTIRRAIKIFERLQATHDLERARGALLRIKPAGKHPEGNVVGLYEVVKIVNSTLNLEEVLNRVLDIALRRLRAERGMIILLDPITSELRTRVIRNIRDGADTDSKRSPQAIIKEVIQTGKSIISADARADDRFIDSDSVISENIVSTLCVPLVVRERIAGAIYVDHRQTRHLFSQRDLNFLEAFADQAAIAIENARLYEELENARVRLSLENEALRKEVLVEKHLDSVVGHSEVVARIQFTIKKAATANSTVLIRGESGTGKGLVARIIHNVGPRRNGPFIKFNCAALPENLAESELFGHEKGSFTGADRRKLGRFELANGGTIFLDEISKTSLAMQAKLLRVVEDKEFERVGGTQTIKTEVKIIAAANENLERAIEQGTFREDLFYRLNIIPFVLPPLRDRKEDIPLLSEHFIRKICRDLGVEPKRLEPGILDVFMNYDWPGNIRELEASLHRAIVMSTGDNLGRADFYGVLGDLRQPMAEASAAMMPDDLLNPMIKRMPLTDELYDDVITRVDRQLIRQALEQSGGKIRETARRLGLARNTLKAKMQKYNLSPTGE